MARTILKDKTALVLGVENAPGRACAQQLAREGVRVILAGTDEKKVHVLGEQLTAKQGKVLMLDLARDVAQWPAQLVEARRQVQHIHLVVNALALGAAENGDPVQEDRMRSEAMGAEAHLLADLAPRGPVKAVMLWPSEAAAPPLATEHWRCLVRLEKFQRADGETLEGLHLRAAAIGDAVVTMLSMPPSAAPVEVLLRAVRAPKEN
jgi:NAD(P)-dependent dehydrogenase (short-subunit alcohol dehydrogenase family)